MKISGSGSISGGEYQQEIEIHGSGKVTGSTSCTDFLVSGTGKVEGDLKCSGSMKISGNGDIKGDLDATEAHVSGTGKVEGKVSCEKVTVSGTMRAASFTAKQLHVSGYIQAEEGFTAEDVVIHGAVKAGGAIKADKLEIVFDGNSSVESIEGKEIRIRKKGVVASFFQWLFQLLSGRKNYGYFTVGGSIEGEDIELENVIAASVIGDHVKLGPGCQIGTLSCTGTYDCDETAVVGAAKQKLLTQKD